MNKFLVVLLLTLLLLIGCGHEETKPLMPENEFSIIAHRGASAYAPEHTLASYELAEEMDADYIELDIHLTKDGEVVVMHDEDVTRTTKESGDIASYTLAELKQLSADFPREKREAEVNSESSEEHAVPALAEVFERFGERIHYFIELKESEANKGIEEKLVNLLEEYEMIGNAEDGQPKAVVLGFAEEGLKKVRELNEDIPLIKLFSFDEGEGLEALSEEEIEEVLTYGVGIGIRHKLLEPNFIKKMQDKGLHVYATAVQETEAALKMKEIGANGIFTNHPDVLDNRH